ncbi:MAG: hypothetical protein ACKVU2_03325 [Saprospiraceae bacterium]
MQPNRFFRLVPILLALAAGAYFFACQQDTATDPASPKVTTDLPADDRMCPGGTCEFLITVDGAADIVLCGDITGGTGTCSFNCAGSGTNSSSFSLQANETARVCVQSNDGQICISQATVASVGIRVQFGTSTPINTTLFAGTPLCFNTDGFCGETNAGCN